jgi:hypothetical protein
LDIYKVISWGTAVGLTASAPLYLHISAVGKRDNTENPYCVANELVASEVGKRLRLPVPPSCVVQDGAGVPYFACLDFNLTGITLPPILPGAFAATFGDAVADILVFDAYIGNSDRHSGNLAADYGTPRYNVFDHSHVLFGGTHHGITGIARLTAAETSLVIDQSIGGNRHCLIDVLADDRPMRRMLERIEGLDDYFLEDVVSAASDYGLSSSEASALLSFLKLRKSTLRQLIANNKLSFSGIGTWSLL